MPRWRGRLRIHLHICFSANARTFVGSLFPEIVERDGKKKFVVLSYEEFLAIKEALADADDLTELRAAKKEEHHAPGIPLEQVVEELEL